MPKRLGTRQTRLVSPHPPLSWFQAYDIQRFNACLDFVRCDDTLLSNRVE